MDMNNSLDNIRKEGFRKFCASHNLTEAIYAHLVGRIVQVEYVESGCLLNITVNDLSIRCLYPVALGDIPEFRTNDWVEILGTLWTHLQVYSLSGITIVDVAPAYDHSAFTEVYIANAILERRLFSNDAFNAKLNLPNLSLQEGTIYCSKPNLFAKKIPYQSAYIYGHLVKIKNKYHDIILDVDEMDVNEIN